MFDFLSCLSQPYLNSIAIILNPIEISRMPETFNIYCDESCHLQSEKDAQFMVLGALRCPDSLHKEVLDRIRTLKKEHGKLFSELKWTRVSHKMLPLYKDIVNFFFDKDDLFFRAIIVDKAKLNHGAFQQTHDNFYYKIYFRLLERMMDPANQYRIYLDLKDTQGHAKISQLKDFLCNSVYDFSRKMVAHIQEVRSHEVALLQVVDILIGALQYANRFPLEGKSLAKNELVQYIKNRSGLSLQRSTFSGANKFNVLIWEPKSHV